MINIKGGPLWQWSIGRQVIITPKSGYTVNKVEFANRYTQSAVLGEAVIGDDGIITAIIPPALLQHATSLTVYATCSKDGALQTVESVIFKVNGRAKPDGYINTSEEIREYDVFNERLTHLEDNLEEFSKTDFGVVNQHLENENIHVTPEEKASYITRNDIIDDTLWKIMPTGFDLNDALGKYRTVDNSVIASLLNTPFAMEDGELTVEFHPSVEGGDYGVQELRFTNDTLSLVCYRPRRNQVWGTWKTHLTDADVEALGNASGEALANAKAYTDEKLAELIGGAPETFDTLKELAEFAVESEDAIVLLNSAISGKAAKVHTHTKSEITDFPTSMTPTTHNQSASTITAGTLGGAVVANASAVATLGTKQVRNIYAGTAELEAGVSSLPAGDIYFQLKS